MNSSEIAALKNYLATISPSTSINDVARENIKELLANCWPSLSGSHEEATTAEKIYRAENITWSPPNLCFALERHGGTVHGSSRAELHHWEVDLSLGVAKIVKNGRRQLSPMSKRMDIHAKAQETAKLISAKIEHPSIHWIEPGVYAVVNISEVIPETNQRTTTSRRKNYREQLDKEMTGLGWARKDKGSKIGFRLLTGLS